MGKELFRLICANTVLRNYSIVKRHGENLSIHRLMQAVVRGRVNQTEKKKWAEASFKLINNAFVFD